MFDFCTVKNSKKNRHEYEFRQKVRQNRLTSDKDCRKSMSPIPKLLCMILDICLGIQNQLSDISLLFI